MRNNELLDYSLDNVNEREDSDSEGQLTTPLHSHENAFLQKLEASTVILQQTKIPVTLALPVYMLTDCNGAISFTIFVILQVIFEFKYNVNLK